MMFLMRALVEGHEEMLEIGRSYLGAHNASAANAVPLIIKRRRLHEARHDEMTAYLN